ncbi:MAG: hypothetical protein V1798_00120 [Pseudomonadota bacterium]
MPLDGNPKKFAMDVAVGLVYVNQSTLKRFSQPEIQKISTGIQTVQKELRTQNVEAGDYQALKDKGLKLQRLNGAMMAIRMYARDKRFTVS